MAIRSFATKGTEDIFNEVRSKVARKTCPEGIWPVARRKLYLLNAVTRLADLAIPRGMSWKLSRRQERPAQHPDQRAVSRMLRWAQHGPEDVEITDYH